MEIEDHEKISDIKNVIAGHKVCQTKDAKWMCIDNIFQKFHRPNFYDIGGTYIEDVADFWLMYKTEQIHDIFLLHIFVCNRQECEFTVAISQSPVMKIDRKSETVFLAQSYKEHIFNKTKEMTQNYLTTYSFSKFDVDLLKDRKLFIGISFISLESKKGLSQSVIDLVKLNHDFRALLKDPIESDFVIESADEAKFLVHKILLEAHSEVFKAMLKEETAESQNGCVKLVDVGKEDLHCILEYIYTGTISDLDNCNFVNMLMFGDRYNIKGLRDIAQYALAQQICLENIVDIFVVADMYNTEGLKYAAISFIKKNPSVINTCSFKEISNADLMRELCEYLIPT